MNVFDFDNTIYDGESSLDFFKFCVRHKPSLARYLPKVIAMAIRYKRELITKEEIMEFCADMLLLLAKNTDSLDDMLKSFWKKNARKLKPDILNIIHEDDAVISASPDFMFGGIRQQLKGAEIISTQTDLKAMKIISLCYGENKPKLFKERYPGVVPENFYTDNLNDMPMILLSKNSWLVKKGQISHLT